MHIGEMARKAGVTVDAVRFYERKGLIAKTPRSAGRFRLYSADDLTGLNFIRGLQQLGFSLQEIRQLLPLRSNGFRACAPVRELLAQKLTGVRTKIRALQGLEQELRSTLRKCNRELSRRQRKAARGCPVLSALNESGTRR